MSTYLEQLPDEIYELIFKNLEDIDTKIQLLKIRPVKPKLFLQSLEPSELEYFYVNLKQSKIKYFLKKLSVVFWSLRF